MKARAAWAVLICVISFSAIGETAITTSRFIGNQSELGQPFFSEDVTVCNAAKDVGSPTARFDLLRILCADSNLTEWLKINLLTGIKDCPGPLFIVIDRAAHPELRIRMAFDVADYDNVVSGGLPRIPQNNSSLQYPSRSNIKSAEFIKIYMNVGPQLALGGVLRATNKFLGRVRQDGRVNDQTNRHENQHEIER